MKAILTEIELSSPKVSDEQIVTLQKYLPSASFKKEEDFVPNSWDSSYVKDNEEENKKIAKGRYEEYLKQEFKELAGYTNKFLCDINLFLTDFPNIKFTVTGTREVNIDVDSSEALVRREKAIEEIINSQKEKITSMMEAFVKMSNNIAENLKVDTLNQKCDVHVGGGMLMTINEVLLLENECTDRLQSELNSGWRIIAVNVQTDCRRPDYVLGRFNPNYEAGGSAKR